MWNWLREVGREYAVETAVLLSAMGQTLSASAAKEFEWRQACRVDLGYEAELCAEMAYRGLPIHPASYKAVEAAFTLAEVWREPVRSIVPAALVLFAGSWSDRTGRRRPAILFPLIGEVLFGVVLLIALAVDAGLVTVALARALPGLFGDTTVLMVGVLSYISDWTDEETRTRRIGRLTIALLATNPLAVLAARFIYTPGRYIALFAPSLAIAILALLAAVFFVKDKAPLPLPENPVRDFFDPRKAVEAFKVVFKKREDSTRTIIFLLLAINIFAQGPGAGEGAVLYPYLKRFELELIDIFHIQLYSQIVNFVGSFLAMIVLVKYFKIKDYVLGTLSAVNKIICNISYVFATTLIHLYGVTSMELFLSCNSIAFRSMASKAVPNDELGKLYSVFGLIDLILPTVFVALYGLIYNATSETLVGAYYLVSCVFIVLVIIMYLIISKLMSKKEEEQNIGEVTTVEQHNNAAYVETEEN